MEDHYCKCSQRKQLDEKDSQAVKGGKIFWYDYFDGQHHGVSTFHEIHFLTEGTSTEGTSNTKEAEQRRYSRQKMIVFIY